MGNKAKGKTKKSTADQLSKLDAKFRKSINPLSPAFEEMTKDKFKDEFKGKLPFDLDQAWQWIVSKRK